MAYSPQQNGVAKSKKMTIVDMAKIMLHDKKLPFSFWGVAVNTTVYIVSKCPTKAVKDKTPFEAFSGRRPRFKHLKVFDCICYCHVLG